MLKKAAKHIRGVLRALAYLVLPELQILKEPFALDALKGTFAGCSISAKARVSSPCFLVGTTIGDYSYVAPGAVIMHATIGRFCSIGPKLLCGWGTHPVNGISTAPMFYSTRKQNGVSLSRADKTVETKPITIGSDVFIGMHVTILDGITIGNCAVIGAGAVVSKDIPAFAIAYGNPIKVRRYRFDEYKREALLRIRWWDPNFSALDDVETFFFDVDGFIQKHDVEASPPHSGPAV